MLPDVATMFVAGTGAGVMDLDFWADVYGFSYRYCDHAPLSLFSQAPGVHRCSRSVDSTHISYHGLHVLMSCGILLPSEIPTH